MSSPSAPLQTFAHDVEFYATCGTGLDALLASEFKQLGFSKVQSAGAGVRFSGPLSDGYRACLWSRLANRVLLPIHRGPAASPEALYELVQQIDWAAHLDVDGSLAVDFFTANSEISHSQYGALKVKDAVVDQFREHAGRRPDVDRDTPDVRINVYLFRNQARIAIDLSGSSLHRRGYRGAAGLAPLKENLAAAVLMASDWPAALAQGKSLFDPLCGSGTLLIEAAMMATQQAPGLLRDYFGFTGWKHHDDVAWQAMLVDAHAARCESPVVIAGADHDPDTVDSCLQNIQAAGLHETVSVSCQSLASAPPNSSTERGPGFLVTNPPYGERLAGDAQFYASMGTELSRYYGGWSCNLFTAAAAPFSRARLPLSTVLKTRNGGIDCVLLHGQIPAAARADIGRQVSTDTDGENIVKDPDNADHPQASLYRGQSPENETRTAMGVDATPFVNRLKKNQRALKGWLKQNHISAYRVYDSDLPEFAVAIDIYHEGHTMHCVVQEYQAPQTVNTAMAEARLEAIMQALPDALGTSAANVHLKVRQVKSGNAQYEKHASHQSANIIVEELGAQLELNLSDYLDTGLFLDHRPVRRYIQQNATGKRFLNLFAYTATATVAAVSGGAKSSVSVDSSNRYCQWAKRNLDKNGAAAQLHEVVRQDVFTWLEGASLGLSENNRFDLVLLDPPTFSNSSDHENDWDVQRDHVKAIDACLSIMAPGSLLIFSNNYRRFKMDLSLLENTNRGIRVEERSRWSIDRDYHRNQRIHQCWFIFKD
ncbi:MAG: bifunctional 23S rRNA (guanine(2069)-N(7))-methyltransferase RlmK/23S rRNA (guanine(2445)-N(2))-methyltransferase RlmL [Granulosicoccus sp.]